MQGKPPFDAFRIALMLAHFVVGLFLSLRSVYHMCEIAIRTLSSYHNNSPQIIRRDVSQLEKLPRHIAVVLKFADDDKALETLLEQAGSIAAWCLGAGTQELTIYEKSGALKDVDPNHLHRVLSKKVARYFGALDDEAMPKLMINIPPNTDHQAQNVDNTQSGQSKAPTTLMINIISQENGREAIVDLSKTLATMAKKHELHASDLTTAKIDVELKSVTFGEPDLVILFSPDIDLQGFPPWHIRLSEIFYLPDNNSQVTYYVFYKALESFSHCKINVGK